jgi:multiple sugar transport system permease protein
MSQSGQGAVVHATVEPAVSSPRHPAALPSSHSERPTAEPVGQRPYTRPQLSDTALAYLLNAPALILVVLLVAYPIVSSFWISLHQYNLKRPDVFEFIGFGNYVAAFQSDLFRHSLRITATFTLASVAFVLVIGTGIALVVNETFRGRGMVRALILLPWAIPPIVNGLMWQWIFNSKVGALNGLLYSLGIIDSYRSWLLDSNSAIAMLVLAQVWNDAPFAAIVVLASLQAIPAELYDAANVDRAGVIQRFRHVTLPWLVPAFVIIMIVETLAAVRVFDIVYVMTGGGPGYDTTFLSWLTYQTSFLNLDFGQGNAYAYIIAIIALVLSLLYMRVLQARGDIRQ